VRYRHDPTRIRQVLKHLVDNAIKFTPEGYVFVRVRLGDDDALNFEVGDTGIGIPPDKIDRVFDRFYQVDGSSCREHGGAGIGLSICHALVSLWGGRFTVQSEPGRGSVFSFTVPAWRAEDEMERSIGRSDRPGGHLRVVLSQPEREDGSKGR
jgi:signal transduction histidine kinase